MCFLSFLGFSQSFKKPNVIYIYADDLGYGELGSYGQTKIKTPFLDQMAKEGLRFTRHYSSAPVCAPSRAALMTGKHTGHSPIRGNFELGGFEDSNEGGQMPLPKNTFTLATLFKQAGYVTGAIGKWGLGMHTNTGNPNEQGFDYFYGYYCQKQAHSHYPTHLWENGQWDSLQNKAVSVHQQLPEGPIDTSLFNQFIGKEYAVTKLSQKAQAFINIHKDQPFFLYLPFTLPHVALQAPMVEVNKYRGQFEEVPYLGTKGYAPNLYPLSTYAAMITYMDEQIGKIFKLLKQLNLDENTIVFFSSDNGATFDVGGVQADFFKSVGNLSGRKMDLNEGGIRVPFIARWPGKIKPNSISNLPTVQYDMMATMADLIHQPLPPTDGYSFLSTLLFPNKIPKKRPFIYFEFPEKSGEVAIIDQKWKGIKTNVRKNQNALWQIYDLAIDPKETNNIAKQHPELVSKFDLILKSNHEHPAISAWDFIDSKPNAKN